MLIRSRKFGIEAGGTKAHEGDKGDCLEARTNDANPPMLGDTVAVSTEAETLDSPFATVVDPARTSKMDPAIAATAARTTGSTSNTHQSVKVVDTTIASDEKANANNGHTTTTDGTIWMGHGVVDGTKTPFQSLTVSPSVKTRAAGGATTISSAKHSPHESLAANGHKIADAALKDGLAASVKKDAKPTASTGGTITSTSKGTVAIGGVIDDDASPPAPATASVSLNDDLTVVSKPTTVDFAGIVAGTDAPAFTTPVTATATVAVGYAPGTKVDPSTSSKKLYAEVAGTVVPAFTSPATATATVASGLTMPPESNLEGNIASTDTSPSPKNLYSIFSKMPSKSPTLTTLGKT